MSTARTPLLTRTQTRQLVISVGAAGGGTLGVGLLAVLVGFRLHLPFFVLLAVAVGLGVWLIQRVVEPAVPVEAVGWDATTGEPSPRQAEPRVRVLESQLWGAERGMNLRGLHSTLTGIARGRCRRRPDAPVPPTLQQYLSADPPPTLTRRQLRQILEEIRSL